MVRQVLPGDDDCWKQKQKDVAIHCDSVRPLQLNVIVIDNGLLDYDRRTYYIVMRGVRQLLQLDLYATCEYFIITG